MLHAANLIRDESFFRNHFDIYECSDDIREMQRDLTESQQNVYNDRNRPSVDRCYKAPCDAATRGPVIAQLAGHDVATVVTAAQKIVTATNGRIAGIDLNLGCPQNIARKGNYGAYLMENHPSTACQILKALRDALPSTITVSAKIRLPYHPAQQKVRLEQLCDTGINFMTIHGRDYTENKTTVKHIQLPRLIEAVNTVREYSNGKIPVIVNGGIEFVADAIRIQQQTGAAAIMSSEALLERPNLLGAIQIEQQSLLQSYSQELLASFETEESSDMKTTPQQQFYNQIQFALDYIQWCYHMPPLSSGLGTKGGSFNVIRAHLFKILYRYLNDPINYDLRDQLGSGYSMQRLDQAEVLIQTLSQRYKSLTASKWDDLESSFFPKSTWYRRHRSSSVFVHERIKPIAEVDDRIGQSLPQPKMKNSMSIDERKVLIRKKIEMLQDQKKIRMHTQAKI
jgi:tRNA-dihydrouridine synthase